MTFRNKYVQIDSGYSRGSTKFKLIMSYGEKLLDNSFGEL